MNSQYKYYAFISYSHKDSEWAKWLQHELEYYQLPSTLNGKPGLPSSFRPVFRDEDELSGGDLKPQITSALASSNYLIVICSPNSAQSKYVNEEIREFIEIGKAKGDDYTKRIFPFIIDGKPHQDDNNKHLECFPEILNQISRDDINPIELVAGDVNATGRNHAFVKILAGTLREKEVAFSDLWNKYEQYKIEDEARKKAAEERLYRANARFISDKAFDELDKGNAFSARRAILELYGNGHTKYPYVAEADKVIRRAAYENTTILDLGREYGRTNIFSIGLSNQGDIFAVGTYNRENSILIYKSSNGERIGVIKDIPCSVRTKILFTDNNRRLFVTTTSSVRLYDITSYELLCEWEYPDNGYNDRIVDAQLTDDDATLIVVSNTGKIFIFTAKDFRQIKTLQFEISGISIDLGTHYIEDIYTGEIKKKHYVETCHLKDIVIYKDYIYASCTDGTLRAINYLNGQTVSKKVKDGIYSIALSSENHLIIGCRNAIKIYYPETLRLKQAFNLETYMKDEYINYAYSSDQLLIVCSISDKYNGSVIRFYYQSKKQLDYSSKFDINDQAIIRRLYMDDSSSMILYLTEWGKVRIWSPQYIPKHEKSISPIHGIKCLPDSSHALINHSDSYERFAKLSLLDYNTYETIKTFEVDLDEPISFIKEEKLPIVNSSLFSLPITLSNDGNFYIISTDNHIEIVETKSENIYNTIQYKADFGFKALYITLDDSTLITFTERSMQYWKFPTLELIKESRYENIRFGSSSIITNNGFLITNSTNGNIFIIKLDTMSIVKELICPDDYTHLDRITISPDEKYIASADRINTEHIYIWELESGVLIRTIEVQETIKDITFSSDNSKLLVVSADKLISYEWGTFEDLINKQKEIFKRPYLLEEEKLRYYL